MCAAPALCEQISVLTALRESLRGCRTPFPTHTVTVGQDHGFHTTAWPEG